MLDMMRSSTPDPFMLEEIDKDTFEKLINDAVVESRCNKKKLTADEIVLTNKIKELVPISHSSRAFHYAFSHNLSLAQKKEIVGIYEYYYTGSEDDEAIDSSSFSAPSELKLKYKMIKDILPKSICALVDRILNDNLASERKQLALKTALDKCYAPSKKHNIVDIAKINKFISDRYFERDIERDKILKMMLSREGGIICLVGALGTGKNTLVKSIADALNCKITELNLSGINSSGDLIGTSRVYSNAAIGKLFRFADARRILVLKDMDKMCEKAEENPFSVFNEFLNSGGKLTDMFLETPVDFVEMGIKCIITVEDTSRIPKSILNKLNIIYFNDYTADEKRKICKDFIVPKVLKKHHLDFINFSEEACDKIANQYSIHSGLFDCEANAKTIVEYLETSPLFLPALTVTADDVVTFLGKRTWKKHEVPVDYTGLSEKFMFFKDLYEPKRLTRILQLFALYEDESSPGERSKLLAELKVLVNILPGDTLENLNIKNISDALDTSHKGMENAKKALLNSATLRKASSSRLRPILFTGPYGVGKTSLCEAFAEAMGFPYVYFQCHEAKYDLTSKIAVAISEKGVSQVLLFLDEIDKMSANNPSYSIQSMIDGNLIADDIDCPIKVDDITIVATCNDLGSIPGALLSRFDIVHIDGYSTAEKKHIATNYMIPKLKTAFNAANLVFDESLIDKLLLYSPELGMRDFEKNATNAIAHALRNGSRLTESDIDEALGDKPIKLGNYPDYSSPEDVPPGVVKAVAVYGNNMGVTTAITVDSNAFSATDTIVGLLGDSTYESVVIAKHVCEKLLDKKIEPVFISFSDGGVKKDGSSGGLATAIAILSFAKGISIPNTYAFTGEIDVHGNIFAIGGVKEKINVAISEGCTKFFLPLSNLESLKDCNYDIELVPVKKVTDITGMLFNI